MPLNVLSSQTSRGSAAAGLALRLPEDDGTRPGALLEMFCIIGGRSLPLPFTCLRPSCENGFCVVGARSAEVGVWTLGLGDSAGVVDETSSKIESDVEGGAVPN